jgi:hypothetical protein
MNRVSPFLVAAGVLICLVGAWQSQIALQKLFNIDSTNVFRSVVALTAIGLLTMALIQSARSLFPIRSWYHEDSVRSWLGDDRVKTLHERLQIQNSPRDFYDLPLQTLCGQIAAVAEAVLIEYVGSASNLRNTTNPLYSLLEGLAGKGAEGDLKLLQSKREDSSGHEVQASNPDGINGQDSALTLIRARLGTHIQRNIDHLQITVGTRWRRLIRISAFALSLVLSLALLLSQKLKWQELLALVGAAVIAGLIGGYLASVFRDVVAVIEKLRHD